MQQERSLFDIRLLRNGGKVGRERGWVWERRNSLMIKGTIEGGPWNKYSGKKKLIKP